MKLESFLRESIESTKSWAAISSLDEESAGIVKKVVNAVKTFKFVGEEVENPEDAHDGRGKINMEFSDGLLDVVVKVSTSQTDGALEFGYLMCAARVNKKYLVEAKDNSKELTYFSHFRKGDTKLDEKIADFGKIVSEFADWYFDMTGTYGKVKLFRTHYEIIEGYHNSNKPRFVAIAGDFRATSEIDELNATAIEHRIL